MHAEVIRSQHGLPVWTDVLWRTMHHDHVVASMDSLLVL